MKIKNRIKELRYVSARDILPNPKNWRTHPKEQADALRGVLAEVGMADAVIARELEDGSLMLIDGHLRTETIGDQPIPVLVLDVNEEEADKILATFDPLSAMANSNLDKLQSLASTIDFSSEAVRSLLNQSLIQPVSLESLMSSDEDADGEDGEEAGDKENPYTDKTKVPPYEITGPKPAMSDIYDDAKCRKLLADIESSNIPEDEKRFLRAAAYRHAVFNFQEIANYYAHSDQKIQQLFEDSALVIVDLDKAIESGWTRLASALGAIYEDEKGSEE